MLSKNYVSNKEFSQQHICLSIGYK